VPRADGTEPDERQQFRGPGRRQRLLGGFLVLAVDVTAPMPATRRRSCEGRIAPYGPERHASHGAHHAALHGRLLGLRAAATARHTARLLPPESLSTLAWPCLRENLNSDSTGARSCTAVRLRPANEGRRWMHSRGRGIRGTDEGLGVRARESGEIVLVGATRKP